MIDPSSSDRLISPTLALAALASFVLLAGGCLSPYQKASSLYDGGEYAEARTQLARGLDRKPEDPKLHLLMARTLVAQEEYREAEVHAQKAFEADATRARGGRLLGKIHWELGRSQKAVDAWRTTRELDAQLVPKKDFGRALAAAIATADSSHAFERALELRRELADIDPEHAEVQPEAMRQTRKKLAEKLVQTGEYRRAVELYDVLAEENDAKAPYAYERGSLYLRLKKPDQAIEAFDAHVAAATDSARLERMLETARRAEDLDAPTIAIRYYQKAVDSFGKRATFRKAKLRLTLAELQFAHDMSAEARGQLLSYLDEMRTLRGSPLEAEVYLTAADTASEAGRNGFATDLLERALEEAPPNWSIASRLAQQYAVQALQSDAERTLNTYIDRASSTADALEHAARWARGRRNYDLAKSFYERLVAKDPDRPKVWMELGRLYAQLGQIEQMKQALDRFVEKHGDNRHDLLEVSSIYAEHQLYEDAESVIKKVRQDHPKSLLVVDRMARLYRKWGKPERIQQVYRRWIQARGDSASDYQLVGERLLRRRKMRQALPFLEEAAERGVADAWLQIADIYQHQRRELDMKRALQKYIDASSNRTRALRAALTRYRATSLTRETTGILEELIEREPGRRSHYERLGQTYLSQGRRQSAFNLWRRYVDQSSNRISALRTVAGWFEQSGNPNLLLKFYRHWLDQDETDPYIYRLVGDAYMKLAPRRWTRRRFSAGLSDDARKKARSYYRRYLEEADPSRSELRSFADSMRTSQMWATSADAYAEIVDAVSSGSDIRLHYAEALLNLGRTEPAMSAFRTYYQARGKTPDDAQKIAKELVEFRYLNRAEPFLNRMFDSDDGDLIQAAFVKLAEVYQHTDRKSEISGLVTRFLDRAPNPAKARQLAVQVLERRGLYGEAAEQIQRIQQFQGKVMGFDLGANLFRAGRIEEARRAFETHANESSFGTVWLKVADFYQVHARPDLAREAFDAAIDKMPDDFKPREMRGEFLLQHGEIAAGRKDFRDALDRASDKQADTSQKTLVDTLRAIGHQQEAAEVARRALKGANQHRDVFLEVMAEHELKTGDPSRVKRIVDRLASSSLALDKTVELLVDNGHLQAAAQLVEEELASGNFSSAGRALVNRPDVFTRLGGLDRLEQTARPLLKQRDSQSSLRAQLGEYFIRQGNYRDGIIYLRSAMEDGRPLYRTVLAHTYAVLGQTDRAFSIFETYLRSISEGRRTDALRRVGVRLELAGQHDLFRRLLEHLTDDEDFGGSATGLYVEILVSSGRLDEAISLIRRTLRRQLAAGADGGAEIPVDNQEALETLIASIEGVAAEGYIPEARALVDELPDGLKSHPQVRQLTFRIAAATGADDLETRVSQARQRLKMTDSAGSREQRLELARILTVNGHYALADRLARPALESGDHDTAERAALFLMRNAFAAGETDRIAALADEMSGRIADTLRAQSNTGRTLVELGLDELGTDRWMPVAERASTPDNVRSALDAAQAAGLREASDELIGRYLEVAERPLSDLRSRVQRAVDRQRPELADLMVEPFQRTFPARLELRLARARLAFRTGEVEEGRSILGDYLEETDFQPRAIERVLRFLNENRLSAEAIWIVEESGVEESDEEESAVELTDRSLRYLGYAHLRLGDRSRGQSRLDRAVDRAPDAAQAATDIAGTLFQDGEFEAALRYGERAVDEAPNRPRGRLHRGLARLAVGQVETGRQDIDASLNSGVNRLFSLYLAGRAALQAGESDIAADYLHRLAKSPNSDDFGLFMPLQLALEAYMMNDAAAEGVDFLESNFPSIAAGSSIASDEVLPLVSGLYEQAGRHQRAFDIYREGIERERVRNPDGSLIPVYLNNLAYTYSTTNTHIDEGFDLARRAIASARSRTPSYLDTLGWLHYRNGNLTAAEQDVRRSLRTSTGSRSDLGELYEHLADIRRDLGFEAEAFWLRRYFEARK